MKYPIAILAAAAMAVAAQAGPVTTPPPVITALGGNVTAIYIFANAADTSVLGLASPAISPIFANHTSGAIPGNAPGDIDNLGSLSGMLTFTLHNTTIGAWFDSTNPDSDGNFHAKITTDFSDFGVGTLSPALTAELAGYSNITFVGFEDHDLAHSSDWDYNDLIFAFSNTAPNNNPGVPEPLTLSLLGAGLLGAFGLRRVKIKKS